MSVGRRSGCRWVTIATATLVMSCLTASFALGQPAVMGQWQNGPIFALDPGPAHIHMLPTGQVMFWGGDEGKSGDNARSWQPATGVITTRAAAGYDLFCSGHAFLPDGRLFVTGGHRANGFGLASASIYDPFTNAWTRQPSMNAGRWYPTNTVLPNGDVLVIAGLADNTYNTLPQVWQAASGTWRSLTSAQLSVPVYPYMFLAPNGKVFLVGPSVTTRYLDTSGTGPGPSGPLVVGHDSTARPSCTTAGRS
jgi:galactose oxidase